MPEYERELFEDPFLHFERRESYVRYENVWDHFVPIEPVAIAGVLRDYERIELAGLELEVLPLPGATVGQVGILVELPGDGRRVALSGETIHSPGRVPRLAPLQWGYLQVPGMVAVHASARWLRRRRVDVLLTSLGEPILADADAALRALETTVGELLERRRREDSPLYNELRALDDAQQPEELARVADRVLVSVSPIANATFVIGDSGRIVALDYGYSRVWGAGPSVLAANPRTRRPLLHSLDGLRAASGAERINLVIPTHFHDDHVAGIPLLQRLQGTACWAPESFADILANPSAYAFPCTWHQPIEVARRLRMDEEVTFDGVTFHVSPPISGHTRFAALLGFEVDGVRYAHTGDQYHFQEFFLSGRVLPWAQDAMTHGHVYRNGALLDGYRRSTAWLEAWRPDVVLSGHQPPMRTDDDFFAALRRGTANYEDEHRTAMALDPSGVHFELDSSGGWIVPYRTHLRRPGTVRATVTVRNPLPHRATLEVRLVAAGASGPVARLSAGAREDVSTELELPVGAPGRRRPYAVELVADGQPFGQVAEALVTVGGQRF